MQGRKCGQLIKSDEAIDKSPAEVCSNNSVRLALERLEWSPEINHMFPPRFKVAFRLAQCLHSVFTREGLAIPQQLIARPSHAW